MLMCCLSCAKAEWCELADRVEDYCVDHEERPQTNYDRLASKTPEELAKWIVEIAGCNECEEMHGFRMCDAAPEKACEDCWAGWLKSPVEVDNGL